MYQYSNVAVQYQDHNQRRSSTTHYKHRQQQRQQQRKSVVRYGISAGEKVLYILIIIAVVATLTVLLSQNATISQINYDIQSVEKETALTNEENSTLQMEVVELASSERIVDIATKELGMTLKDSSVRIMSR